MGKRKRQEEGKKQRAENRAGEEAKREQRARRQQAPPQQSSSSNPSPASNSDPQYQPPPQPIRGQQEGAGARRPSPLTNEQKESVKAYSNGFKLTFGDTWKAMPEEVKATIPRDKALSYYKNTVQRHFSNKTPKSIDPFLEQELEDFNVASPEKSLFFSKVQESLSEGDLKRFMQNKLASYLDRVQIIKEYQKNKKIMKEVPPEHRFIFAVRLCKKFKQEILAVEDLKTCCFAQYILPALTKETMRKYLEPEDIELAEDFSEGFSFRDSNESEAFVFCKVLSKHPSFDMTKAFNRFRTMNDTFWQKLFKYYDVPAEVVTVWLQSKHKFLRKEVWSHFKSFSMTEEFAKQLGIFAPTMTESDLGKLYKMQYAPNYEVIMKLLESYQSLPFKSFLSSVEYFLKTDSEAYRTSLVDHLKHKPIEDWPELVSQVEAFMNYGEEAKDRVKAALKSAYYESGQAEKATIGKISEAIEGAFLETQERGLISKIDWQLEIANALVNAVHSLNFQYSLVSLGTGHGKSVIIQLVARALNNLTKNKVFVVCLNQFLVAQAQMQFKLRNNIEYIALENFFDIPGKNNCHVIYDEIDQMLGVNAFQLKRGMIGTLPAKYRPSIMKEWLSLIAFSGTVTTNLQKQFFEEFKDPFCIQVPSLRISQLSNQLVEVKTVENSLTESISVYIESARKSYKNFVIIFDTLDQLETFNKERPQSLFEERAIFQFTNFTHDFYQTFEQMRELFKDNFVVLTTKEGSRGVDYRGQSPAHVVICYSPCNEADLIQSLGRGSRTLREVGTGAIICRNPLTMNPARYQVILEQREVESLQGMSKNLFWCRYLHGKVPMDDLAQALFEKFRNFVRAGMNMNLEAHDPNSELRNQLLKVKAQLTEQGGEKVRLRISAGSNKKK